MVHCTFINLNVLVYHRYMTYIMYIHTGTYMTYVHTTCTCVRIVHTPLLYSFLFKKDLDCQQSNCSLEKYCFV